MSSLDPASPLPTMTVGPRRTAAQGASALSMRRPSSLRGLPRRAAAQRATALLGARRPSARSSTKRGGPSQRAVSFGGIQPTVMQEAESGRRGGGSDGGAPRSSDDAILQRDSQDNDGNTVCELCGHVGYRQLLVPCEDCKGSTTHRYLRKKRKNMALPGMVSSNDARTTLAQASVRRSSRLSVGNQGYYPVRIDKEPSKKRKNWLVQFDERTGKASPVSLEVLQDWGIKGGVDPMEPLDNVITNDGMNQQDADKQNSVCALNNVNQPSPMVMFNAGSKPIWSGIFKINSEACLKVDAHLSSKALEKVEECSRSLQPVLEVVKLPRSQVWPKGWESAGPTDACIGLYFFPSDSRSNELSDKLVNAVIETDSALKVTAAIADLLIFPSVVLSEQNQLYHGKHYLWGLFRRRKDISILQKKRKDISDEVVLGGEQNGSACAMPVDEGGQQEEHLLNQVEEAQPASSEQITCVINDSHDENPPLVESPCEAQIDEAMETVTEECLTTLPGSSLSSAMQPNSLKAASNCSLHHPEEVSQPGDTVTSPTEPNASTSVAAQLAEKTGHRQSCSGSGPLTAWLFGELIQDVATEGAQVVSVPAEMVTADSASGNSPAVVAVLNHGTDHQQRFEDGEPPQPDVEPSQACLELFPVTGEQMGLAAPRAGTSNIVEVDLELSLGMPVFLHL